MTRIGLISDTHGWLDEAVFEHFKDVDEVWHAGDFGEAPNLTLCHFLGGKEAPPILPGGEGKGDDGWREEDPPILPGGEGKGDDGWRKKDHSVLSQGEGKVDDYFGDRLGVEKSYGDIFVDRFEQLFNRKIIFRGVYGNIDTVELRMVYPEKLFFSCESMAVFMQHIGGYPGRYSKGVKDDIIANKSGLFISGHSHILKIMYDQKLHCLHINPGAAGRQGWHKMRTIVRFAIDGKEIKDCEVIELGERGRTI